MGARSGAPGPMCKAFRQRDGVRFYRGGCTKEPFGCRQRWATRPALQVIADAACPPRATADENAVGKLGPGAGGRPVRVEPMARARLGAELGAKWDAQPPGAARDQSSAGRSWKTFRVPAIYWLLSEST